MKISDLFNSTLTSPRISLNQRTLLSAISFFMICTVTQAQVSPESVDLTLEPGQSSRVTKSVTVPAVTPKLDVMLIVDISSSYRNDIASMRALSSEIVSEVRALVPDSRFGLASFSDFPFTPWGSSRDAAYVLDQPITDDVTAWRAAIDALEIRSGGDGPESQFEAIYQATTGAGRQMPGTNDADFDDTGEIAPGLDADFRSDATRIIILTTDASFHTTGEVGFGFPFPYPGANVDSTADALIDRGITFIGLRAGSTDIVELNTLAARTGGIVRTTLSDSSDIVAAITSGISELNYTIVPDGSTCTGLELSYLPAEFTDVAGGSTVEFDESIGVPADTADIEHSDGVINCGVNFLANSAAIGTQDISVTVPGLSSSSGGSSSGSTSSGSTSSGSTSSGSTSSGSTSSGSTSSGSTSSGGGKGGSTSSSSGGKGGSTSSGSSSGKGTSSSGSSGGKGGSSSGSSSSSGSGGGDPKVARIFALDLAVTRTRCSSRSAARRCLAVSLTNNSTESVRRVRLHTREISRTRKARRWQKISRGCGWTREIAAGATQTCVMRPADLPHRLAHLRVVGTTRWSQTKVIGRAIRIRR